MGAEHGGGTGVAIGAVGGVGRRAAGREQANETARDVRFAQLVGHGDVTGQLELGFDTEAGDVDAEAVARVADRAVAVDVHRDVLRQVAVDEEGVARVDTSDFADLAALLAHRHGQVGGRAVLQALQVEAHIAVVKLFGEAGTHLAAVFGGDVGIAGAFAHAVKATHLGIELVADLAAPVEVQTLLAVIQPQAVGHAATVLFAGLGDEVDQAAWAVGGQGGGRPPADHVQRVHESVGTQELVGGGERNVAHQEDGQAVFLQLHVARATR